MDDNDDDDDINHCRAASMTVSARNPHVSVPFDFAGFDSFTVSRLLPVAFGSCCRKISRATFAELCDPRTLRDPSQ